MTDSAQTFEDSAAPDPAQEVASLEGSDFRLALLLAMAMFVLVVDTSLMNVSISAFVILINSKVGDLIGRKRAYVIGLLAYALGATSMVFANDLRTIVFFWAV